MATFLSPGVFPREIDLSLTPSNVGPLRPVFIGTAKKGPLNTPTFVSNSQQALDIFGEPFTESYLMYAVMSFMEEGNQCYIVRVGVECEDGQDSALDDICIDLSGNKVKGWGRIPLFSGIDYGRITLRLIDDDHPLVIHDSAVANVDYNDQSLSDTDGATTATLNFSGASGLSDDYSGAIDDSWIVLITGNPDDGEELAGATYEVIRNSDNTVVSSGTLAGTSTSQEIDIGDGLVFNIEVTSGRLEENDTFTFSAQPDNRTFEFSVEGGSSTTYTMTPHTYTTVTEFVDDINTLANVSEDYVAIEYTNSEEVVVPQIRTDDAGRWIQLLGSEAWANETGSAKYQYDIPRSHLIGIDAGPYNITSQNNRISIDAIPSPVTGAGVTKHIEFSIANGVGIGAVDIASSIELSGVVAGTTYFNSFALTVPGGTEHVVILTSLTRMFDQLKLLATYSHLKTLRFSEEIGIAFPYTSSHRGFSDNRVSLPASGEVTPSNPLSCEVDEFSSDCASDSAYFEKIVGWLVATSPGTWLDGYTATVQLQTHGVGDLTGRYQIIIKNPSGLVVDLIEDVSFDTTATRYIANVLNPGTTFGGANGNEYVNWEERPSYLENDPVNDPSSYVVRQPAQIYNKTFAGTANGIPLDPAYSSELDAAVIGNPQLQTGIYSVQNSETFDINLLATPGFTSGAVIGQCLQLCESRGDTLYLVDPPFGLRPQQVVDWHNGMLLSDLSNAINSSYGALYWGWLKIFDQFNQQNIWVPPSGHVSAVFSRTSRVAEQWFAPAGINRGRLLTALEVEYNPSLGERDLLYGSGNSVNPIVAFPQDGIVIFGQRTLQRTETALSRVGVRMLLIYLKKNMIRILRSFIFEPNDTTTWSQVRTVLNPFLADIQSRRGLDGFKVVCDETNNTPERRDRNQLWVSVFLKPTKSIEFVVLNLVVLRSSASFSAEEVLAAGGIVTRAGSSASSVIVGG